MKPRKCKYCKDPFIPRQPLQYVCFWPKTCSVDYGKLLAEKKKKKDWIEEKKVISEKLKKLSDYRAEARAVFQRWIRERDKDLPCISCGQFANRYDGGHYFDAFNHSGLVFHEDNCNKQCSHKCNKLMHGNKENYRIGLVKKIGKERVKWLEDNAKLTRTKKFTKEYYIGIKEKYSDKLRELHLIFGNDILDK